MNNTGLRTVLFFSLAGHILLLALIDVYIKPDLFLPPAPLIFLGEILHKEENKLSFPAVAGTKKILLKASLPEVKNKSDLADFGFYNKPESRGGFSGQKVTGTAFLADAMGGGADKNREERALFFYPKLPHNFILYFNDRSTVHIELDFFVASSGNVVEVKRRVSSGNLDVDLLVWRYVSQWLFVHRKQLKPDSWQTVKIDLSRPGQGGRQD